MSFAGTGIQEFTANGLPVFSTSSGAASDGGGFWSSITDTISRGSNAWLDFELADNFGPSDQAEFNDQVPAIDPSQPAGPGAASGGNGLLWLLGAVAAVVVLNRLL